MMKKAWICFVFLFLAGMWQAEAQRKLPVKNRGQKEMDKQTKKNERAARQSATELRWDPRELPNKSKGYPELSAWHTGTTGIIASDAAEISLFSPTRVGFSKRTELLFRIAEEPFLPNAGLKHLWWSGKRFSLASGHTFHYPWPGLKILQRTGFRDLVPDSVKVGQGIAMRHELLFSWLMNPRVWGCPNPPAEKILTLQAGAEFYVSFESAQVRPFDYAHLLYHSQLLDGKVLYYGGLQFDSYFGSRFHYSLNGLFYSVDFGEEYAAEANLRLTYYISRRWGISVAGKGAYLNLADKTKFACVPLLDLTYLVNPGRAAIKHGLFKKRKWR